MDYIDGIPALTSSDPLSLVPQYTQELRNVVGAGTDWDTTVRIDVSGFENRSAALVRNGVVYLSIFLTATGPYSGGHPGNIIGPGEDRTHNAPAGDIWKPGTSSTASPWRARVWASGQVTVFDVSELLSGQAIYTEISYPVST